MRVLIIDFETTSLDPKQARIIEAGYVLWDAVKHRPLITVACFYKDESYGPILEVTTQLTGITQEILDEFGTDPKANLMWLEAFCVKHRVDFLVAHNAKAYDQVVLYSELDRHSLVCHKLRSLPILDTKMDLPFKAEPDSRKLKYLAADHGFVNPFSHRAIFDCLTTGKLLSHYNMEEIIANSKKKRITVRALVDYSNRQAAKDRKYFWHGETKTWRKEIFEDQLETERGLCNFQIGVIENG